MTLPNHTDRTYTSELQALREQLLLMGARVEEVMKQATIALETWDAAAARAAMPLDAAIDQAELDLDEACVRILAKRHPVASDLRFITTVLKVVTDLERCGDLATNVCERIVELEGAMAVDAPVDLPGMLRLAQGMLRDALDALVDGDVEKAKGVVERDRGVDARYKRLFPALLAAMESDSRVIYPALRLQSVGKYIERMADHATNIAEMVQFMVEGRDVRHGARSQGPRQSAPAPTPPTRR